MQGLGSSFTVPNTPHSQCNHPSTPCAASPLGTRSLKHGRGTSMVSFAVKDTAHDPEDSGLASPFNSSVASMAGALRPEGSRGVGPGVGPDLQQQQQQQQQQGRLHHLGSSKSSVGGVSFGGMGQRRGTHLAPAAAVPDALLQQSEEAAAINAALQLLDAYSQYSARRLRKLSLWACLARLNLVAAKGHGVCEHVFWFNKLGTDV
eukprot:1150961-Pelagomonas_calceolata.AAC.15